MWLDMTCLVFLVFHGLLLNGFIVHRLVLLILLSLDYLLELDVQVVLIVLVNLLELILVESIGHEVEETQPSDNVEKH